MAFLKLCFSLFILGVFSPSEIYAEVQRVQAAPGDTWDKASTRGQAVVWTREVPGTSIKEVKLEAVIDAPIERVWRTLTRVEHYTKFLPYMDEIKVVKQEGMDRAYVYHRINPPLVSQRDYTLLVVNEVDTEKGRYYRYWTQKNQFGPKPIKGIVRLLICDGSWSLTAREDGRTQATYWLYTDLGGSIPAWLANSANTSGLYDILWAIEARAQDLNWQ
ncbi:polyketide cyclase / dehydrase family protein [Shewanella psychrophila]|uniref:Polyketide cyclase / dehydrase family protein n=1 Tax=Shewanella psychrophila TaxID=225848 RepID=A0A1S6HT74_9GAMM|nr:START domain-containing protein [Shewanella psychrophila]AQS38702.1 polyketide cyclase / dehydrase family protein [Shewanella psychrophila]